MDGAQLARLREELQRDLFGLVLPFWLKHGLDPVHGGINTCLDREGNVFSVEKSVWMQGRGGWMFAHLCNVFGENPAWREAARSALEFAKGRCIDPLDGRMYFVVGADGAPVRKRRYVFSEYFYIMANAEYYGLTGGRAFLEEAAKYYRLVKGIWSGEREDPFYVTPKFLPTAPAMRGLCGDMVLLLAARTLRANHPEGREEYEALERRLIKGILSYHWNPQLGALLENVGPGGEYLSHLSGGRVITPGHCLECAWYLLTEAEELGEPCLVEQAERIYGSAWQYGWDSQYGGLLYLVDAAGQPPQAYEHDMKLWWVHTEGLIAAVKLYRLTGKERYWQDFIRLKDYVFEHFRDGELGEWVGYLRRDGQPTQPVCKGNLFKGPFHVPRMYCQVLQELDRLIREGPATGSPPDRTM